MVRRFGKMSLFDKLILGVRLLHPVFLSDVLSDVIGMTSNYSADSALSNCQSNFARLTTCVFVRQKIGDVFMIHPVCGNINSTTSCSTFASVP